MTHRYTVAGIRFVTADALFEHDDRDPADIDVALSWVAPDSDPSGVRYVDAMGMHLWVDADRCEVWLPELFDLEPARAWQLRNAAPIVSSALGRLVLHASAVSSDHGAIAFVGESGSGKSSIAWAGVQSGRGLISDDLLPVRFGSAVTTLGSGPPRGLVALCFLERNHPDAGVTPLSSREVFDELVRHGFGEHLDPAIWAFQFDAYATLAGSVPGLAVRPREGREHLATILDEVEGAVAADTGAGS